MNNTDTPRTDAAIPPPFKELVTADFARSLERELAEATAGKCTCVDCGKTANNAWRDSDGQHCLTCLAKERDEARVALAAASGIFDQITQSLTKERDELRKDLCEIAAGCGVGVPDQSEAKRRIIAIAAERDHALARCDEYQDRLGKLRGELAEIRAHGQRVIEIPPGGGGGFLPLTPSPEQPRLGSNEKLSDQSPMKTHKLETTVAGFSSLRRMVRAVARWTIFRVLLSERRWYRRLVGGRWERWHIDFPVCSCMWMDVPMDAPLDYREPLWRGTPEREVWLDGSNAESSDSRP